ncbi:hypothetical protein GRJ2_002030200 [Grus japonensis]|uniref:Uncharacterized protein n=1 Tax=Grus japonensis TaxID=30415 RepID=A0ABC9XDL2_GRUJA
MKLGGALLEAYSNLKVSCEDRVMFFSIVADNDQWHGQMSALQKFKPDVRNFFTMKKILKDTDFPNLSENKELDKRKKKRASMCEDESAILQQRPRCCLADGEGLTLFMKLSMQSYSDHTQVSTDCHWTCGSRS